ncbi:MAG: ABC transporter permease subunit [Candidatus Moranbacteria bacterium]|nr:ABC transporter permease subunit [Candidatus Moranbacteria bacterium]
MLNILIEYRIAIIRGLGTTLIICSSAWSIGVLGGIIFGYLAQKSKTFSRILSASSFLLISIPVLVLLFWLHYPAQALLSVVINPLITTIVALSAINIVLTGELIKKALENFPFQYVLAARVCGIEEKNIFLKIKLPIIFRQVLPGIITLQVSIMHMSLFGSLISVEEIFRISQQINSQIYRPVEIYTALALLFVAVSLPLNLLAYYLKNKYTRNLSEK